MSVGLDAYQRLAAKTDQNKSEGLTDLSFFLLGLLGEVGQLLSALKKRRRDPTSCSGYHEAIYEEFGDVLWYYCNIANRASLNLSVLAQRAQRDLDDWDEVGLHEAGSFDDIQFVGSVQDSADTPEFQSTLIALAGKVGLLLNDCHLGRIERNRDILSAHLVEILRSLIDAAGAAGINLAVAAEMNLAKTESRWPSSQNSTQLFDDDFDSLEQLPRLIKMHFMEVTKAGKTFVIQQCNGINIGAALTDNRREDDDYRFHDVFHLSFASILGWSPILRSLFNLKRKSNPKIDEAEDGARAKLIEEGISTLIFNQARKLDFFEGVSSVDYSLLKLIPVFVAGYEVEKCRLWEWEKAILDGFAVFRKVKEHRGGIVIANLVDRSLTFSERN